jgi:hypothetical protein
LCLGGIGYVVGWTANSQSLIGITYNVDRAL